MTHTARVPSSADPFRDGPPWPDWSEEFRVDEDAFAAAHDALSPFERALIKQSLARLFAVHDPGAPVRRQRCDLYAPDVVTRSLCHPRPWAVVALGREFASPVRLVAACIPAVRARVGTLAVVRVDADTPWPPPLLAALELAGVETAFAFTAGQASRFFMETARTTPGGAVVDFGPAGRLPGGVLGRGCNPAGTLGVWRSSVRGFDLPALAFAHPGGGVEVWGKTSGLPGGFVVREGDFDDFLTSGYEAVFVPTGKIQAALDAPFGPPLALGPGMEFFWVCTGLAVADFLETRVAFGPVCPGRGGGCP